MIKSLMQEILGEDSLDEKNMQNKLKKTAWQKSTGEKETDVRAADAAADAVSASRRGNAASAERGFAAAKDIEKEKGDTKLMMQRGRKVAKAGLAGAQLGRATAKQSTPDIAGSQSPVPQDIQGKIKQGGKVVFGKYFDSAGTFLGSVKQGKWIPAGQGQQAGTLEENKTGMIRLTQLLNESMLERRVNLMKVQAIMEKLYPELTDAQSKKLIEICTEVHMIASQLNTTRYIRTEGSLVEWKLLVMAIQTKLNELKEEVVSVCEQKKIDPSTVVKAIDEVLLY